MENHLSINKVVMISFRSNISKFFKPILEVKLFFFLVIRYPFLDQNTLTSIPYPRPNCLKTIPLTVAHTYIGYIWEYTPPPSQNCLISTSTINNSSHLHQCRENRPHQLQVVFRRVCLKITRPNLNVEMLVLRKKIKQRTNKLNPLKQPKILN